MGSARGATAPPAKHQHLQQLLAEQASALVRSPRSAARCVSAQIKRDARDGSLMMERSGPNGAYFDSEMSPEAARARTAYFQDGGIVSCLRTVKGARPEKKLQVFEMMARDAITLGRKALLDDIETLDAFHNLAVSDGIAAEYGEDEIQAALARAIAAPIAPGTTSNITPEQHPQSRIVATPFTWRDPESIPRRAWLYGRHYIRRFVSATVAPGGLGKSTLVLAESVAMASGRGLLGTMPDGRLRVWYWNGEDPVEEISRRIAVLCQYYTISKGELEGYLFIDSGRDLPLSIASMAGGKVSFNETCFEGLCAAIQANRIDVFTADPFISMHGVPEGDNGAIDAVVKKIGHIADRTNTSIELVHHVRKMAQGQSELTVEDVRGASALVNATRAVRVLNRMTTDQASLAGVDERRRYIRADTGKANLAPPSVATWFQHVAIDLANGDSVSVISPWTMPGAMDAVTVAHMHQIRELARGGEYRKDVRSEAWIGRRLAEILGFDPENVGHRKRLKGILAAWFKNKVLATQTRPDDRRRGKEFVVPGPWEEEAETAAPV